MEENKANSPLPGSGPFQEIPSIPANIGDIDSWMPTTSFFAPFYSNPMSVFFPGNVPSIL
jgi:hypothetical protein